MSAIDRAALLGKWIKPSSENEQGQQARAEDMIRKAITTCDAFDGSNVQIYTKGSYPNNTNVRRDSDVDVVVELHDCYYWDYTSGVSGPSGDVYQGSWTPAGWREAVVDALVVAFGAESVDTSGKIAVNISAVEGKPAERRRCPQFQLLALRGPGAAKPSRGELRLPDRWWKQSCETGPTSNL